MGYLIFCAVLWSCGIAGYKAYSLHNCREKYGIAAFVLDLFKFNVFTGMIVIAVALGVNL